MGYYSTLINEVRQTCYWPNLISEHSSSDIESSVLYTPRPKQEILSQCYGHPCQNIQALLQMFNTISIMLHGLACGVNEI